MLQRKYIKIKNVKKSVVKNLLHRPQAIAQQANGGAFSKRTHVDMKML